MTWLMWREKQKPSGGILGSFTLNVLHSTFLYFTSFTLYRVALKKRPELCVTITARILYGEKFLLHFCRSVCTVTYL